MENHEILRSRIFKRIPFNLFLSRKNPSNSLELLPKSLLNFQLFVPFKLFTLDVRTTEDANFTAEKVSNSSESSEKIIEDNEKQCNFMKFMIIFSIFYILLKSLIFNAIVTMFRITTLKFH